MSVLDSTYLELLDQGVVDLAAHGREDALLGKGPVEDLLDGDGAGNANWDRLANRNLSPIPI